MLPAAPMAAENDMRAKIMAIMTDKTLTDVEKGRKRQELLMGRWAKPATDEPAKQAKESSCKSLPEGKQENVASATDAGGSGSLDENLQCTICMNLCERPVTAPCQHNFCLGCFNKWHQQGKKTCPTCRAPFPAKFAQNPRINTALTFAIRLAKNPVNTSAAPAKEYKRIDNESRPDEAFVTERAQKTGRANAASGRIMVTIPNDHFGPIGPEFDPTRKQGVLVGEWWKDRLDCRQWGAHFPHVAGIAGQSGVGSQSVVLSGGYEDDKDEGEWFLYTGSGGRDLSGNKRTSKIQSFDQEFENMNKALKLSCIKGLPVRVVRSFKEKRSSYAPTSDTPVRYDGVYRILRCWRKPGNQKQLMCRYLFVRCDNSPAPWSSGEGGDAERFDIPKEAKEEIKQAHGQVFEMSKEPAWTWLEAEKCWGWASGAPPESQQRTGGGSRPANTENKLKKKLSQHEKALKEFKCEACKGVLCNPLRTPCGHNFCRGCLDKKFEGITDVAAPSARGNMRVRRNLKPCPSCKADLCEFLATAQVNREMVAVIQKLQEEVLRAREEAERLKAAKDEGKEEGEAEEDKGDEEAGEDDGEQEDEDGQLAEDEEEEDDDDGAKEQEEDEEDEEAGSCDAQEAGPSTSVPAASAAAVAAPLPVAPPRAAPSERYASELEMLCSEFPSFDRELLKSLLEDQAGDVLDVRAMLRMTSRPARKPAANKPGSKAGKGKKRKAMEANNEVEEVDDDEVAEAEPAEPTKTKAAKGPKKQSR